MKDPIPFRISGEVYDDFIRESRNLRSSRGYQFLRPSLGRHNEYSYVRSTGYLTPFFRYSPEVLRALLNNIDLTLFMAQPSERKPYYFWNKETLGELAELARTLKSEHPNTRFFGIGHSPSYLIYGIEHLSNTLNDTAAETGYVPYSARYLRDKAGFRAHSFTYAPDKSSGMFWAVQANQEFYRARLEAMGLHPQKIVDNYKQSGQRTAVVDNMQSGTGFASFIHFMHMWARDFQIPESVLAEAFECIALTDRSMPDAITIPDTMDSIKIKEVRISSHLRYAINGNLSADTDRFVPRYDALHWHRPPRTKALWANSDNVAKVKQMVAEAIDGKLETVLELEAPDDKIDEMYFEKAKVELEEEKFYDALKSLNRIRGYQSIDGYNEVKEAARNGLDDNYFSKAQTAISEGQFFDAGLYLDLIKNKERFENLAEVEKTVHNGRDDIYFEEAKSALENGNAKKARNKLDHIIDQQRIEDYDEVNQKVKAALSDETHSLYSDVAKSLTGRDIPTEGWVRERLMFPEPMRYSREMFRPLPKLTPFPDAINPIEELLGDDYLPRMVRIIQSHKNQK